MKKQGKTHTPTRGIKSKLLKIATEYEEVETDFKKLEQETRFLNERVNKINRAYKVSVGWTTKYREALAEANRRLREAGLDKMLNNLIERYDFTLINDNAATRLGIIEIEYTIIPIYEIREIRNRVTVKDNSTAS